MGFPLAIGPGLWFSTGMCNLQGHDDRFPYIQGPNIIRFSGEVFLLERC
jgi:hypothetical protein